MVTTDIIGLSLELNNSGPVSIPLECVGDRRVTGPREGFRAVEPRGKGAANVTRVAEPPGKGTTDVR